MSETDKRRDEDFFRLFILSLVLISIPIKNLAYVLPPLYMLTQLLGIDTGAAVRTLLVATLVIVISLVSVFVDSLRGQIVNLPGVFVGLFTFLPLFIMLGQQYNRRIDDELFKRVSRCVAWFVIAQAAIGAIQFAVSSDPDTVSGTLGLLDFYSGSITIMQVYFGFLMLSMVLFLLLDSSTWLARAAIGAGLAVSAVSQSGHQSAFFVGSLALFALLQCRRLNWMLGIGGVLTALAALVLYFFPTTLANAETWYDKTFISPHSPKRLAVEGALAILEDSKNLILGTGMGQYSSRAALITSGEQFRFQLPSFLVGQSDYYRQYLQPALDSFEKRGEGSAISKPYFSWLSVLVEFGLLQFSIVIAVIGMTLARCLRMMYSTVPEIALAGMLGGAGLVFLLLCSAVENYAEFPQAVFVPYLLFVVGIAWARQPSTVVLE